MTDEFKSAIENLEFWDADDQMEIGFVKSSPLYRLFQKIHDYDFEVVNFLLFSICQKVFPCWEFHIEGTELRKQLSAIENYLNQTINITELDTFDYRLPTSKTDCTFSETSGASNTIYYTIRYILEQNALLATYSISAAESANCGNFEEWFIKIALPIAFEKRFLTKSELSEFTYNNYLKHYEKLVL
ncbi:hypothetical protein GCM10027035_17990 [Emticicia sediminis]